MSIATFCHGPSGGGVDISGAWYLSTSSADVVVVSPKSCRNVLHKQVEEYLVKETLGQLTGHYGKVVRSSWKVRYRRILEYRLEVIYVLATENPCMTWPSLEYCPPV